MGQKRQGKAQERRALEETYQRDLEEWYFKWDFDRDDWTIETNPLFAVHLPKTKREFEELIASLRDHPYTSWPDDEGRRAVEQKVKRYENLAWQVLVGARACTVEEAGHYHLLRIPNDFDHLRNKPAVANAYFLLTLIEELRDFARKRIKPHIGLNRELLLHLLGMAVAIGEQGQQLSVLLSRGFAPFKALAENIQTKKSKAALRRANWDAEALARVIAERVKTGRTIVEVKDKIAAQQGTSRRQIDRILRHAKLRISRKGEIVHPIYGSPQM